MPSMTVRNINDVPVPTRSSKAVQEAQMQYEGYIRSVNSDVGELDLSPNENIRSVKVRLRRASSRLGWDIDISDAGGKVYFRVASRRGRPRKTS